MKEKEKIKYKGEEWYQAWMRGNRLNVNEQKKIKQKWKKRNYPWMGERRPIDEWEKKTKHE